MATVPTLSVCCVCKHVTRAVSPSAHWTPMSAFLERHQLRPIDVRLTHTYCPCATSGKLKPGPFR
jgi:hypothetical protein